MTSLPNPASSSYTTTATATASHLSVTPTPSSVRRNNHRHRRSAAISGDFDIMGLGLFSPKQQPSHIHSHSHNITSSSSPTPHNVSKDKKNDDDDFEFGAGLSTNAEFEKRFHFNNEDDFSNKPTTGDFAFPSKTPELSNTSSPSFSFGNPTINTPPRHFASSNFRKSYSSSSHNLNSPIKLNHRKAQSTANTPKTKFFLTEETNINSENVPDAVIDLDEILNANLHIGGDRDESCSSTSLHKRSGSLPKDIFNGQSDHEDDFLASPSPFFKHNNFGNSFSSSPLSAPNNTITLFQQPIQEKTTDSIEEEEDDESNKRSIHNEYETTNEFDNQKVLEQKHETHRDENENTFTNPQEALGAGMYTNSSANSSCSSLRSNTNHNSQNNSNAGSGNASQPSKFPGSHLIEKTTSNSSRESSNSGIFSNATFNNTTPTSKRSGAKANRYQSFYDQSYKITNALKFSSSESINLVRSNSSGQNLNVNDVAGNSNNNINNGSANATNLPRDILLNNTSKQLGHSSSLPSLKSSSSLKRSVTPTTGVAPSARFNDSRFKQEAKKLSPPPSVSVNGVSSNQYTPPSSDASPSAVQQQPQQQQRYISVNTPPLTSSQFSPSKRHQHMKQAATVTPPAQMNVTPNSNPHTSIDGRIESPDYTLAQLSSQPVESIPLANPQHHPLISHPAHLPRSPQQESEGPTQSDQHQPQQSHILMAKNISNSPVSVTSDVSSTVLSTNEASTDHSSLISSNEQTTSSAAPVLKRVKQKQQHTNQLESSNTSTDNMMPAIVISKDVDVTSTSSTDSTFKQVDDDTVDLPSISTVSKPAPNETDSEAEAPPAVSTPLITSPVSSTNQSSYPQHDQFQNQTNSEVTTPTEITFDAAPKAENTNPSEVSSPFKSSRRPPKISIPLHSPQASRISTPINKTDGIDDIVGATPPSAPFATDNSSVTSSSNSSSRSSPRASPKRKRAPRRPLSPSEDKVLKATQIPSFKAPTSAVTTPELGGRRRFNNNDENAHPYSFFASYMRKSSVSSTITQPSPMTPEFPLRQNQGESPRGRHSKSKSFSLVLSDLTPDMTKTNNPNTDDGSSITSSKSKNNRLINWFRKKR